METTNKNKLTRTSQIKQGNQRWQIPRSPRHMPVLGNVHPIKIEFFFRDVISLLARVFIFLIDRATQEVPMKYI